MKKSLLLKPLLLLFALIAGVGSTWAADETIVFSTLGYNNQQEMSSISGTDFTITFDKGSNSNTPKYFTTGAAIRAYGGNTMTVSSETKTITKIELTFGTGDGSNAITTDVVTYSNGTWTGSASSVTFTVGGTTGHRRIASVAVTYSSGLTPSDLALTNAPVALDFDLYNSSAQTISYTTSSTGAVTVSANDYVTTSVNATDKTITVTPKNAVTPETQTITVNQAADDTYAAGSVTFTVSIADTTPFNGVIFNATEDTGESSIVKDNVSLACTSGVLNNESEYRFYKNSTTTISTTDGKIITKIVFEGTSNNPASGFATQTGWTTTGNNGTWTGNAESVSFIASGAQVRATVIKVTVEANTNPSITASDVDIAYNATGGSIAFTVNNEVQGGTISASTQANWITPGNETESSISFTCTANESATVRTATVTLTYSYNDKSVTKDVTVTQAGNPNAPGTQNNPYTVAQAIAATPTSGDVYISGIVSSFYNTSIVGDGSNYRYYISDDGTTTTQLLVYKGKGLNEATFTSADDLLVGDEVVIYGQLITYQNAPEVASGNYLVSWNRPVNTNPSIGVNTYTIEAPAEGKDGTITVTYNNITDVAAEVFFCDANGDAATYDWVTAEINSDNNVDYLIDANNGPARTAYMKVYALDDEFNDVYSNLITITQAAYVAPSKYTLATSITPGKHYIIVGENEGDYYAMAEQKPNNRNAVNVTKDNDKITTVQEVTEFVIYGPDANGYYTIFDANNGDNGGYLYAASSTANHLKTQSTLDANGKWEITIAADADVDGDVEASIIAKGTNTRNVMRFNINITNNDASPLFACYASSSSTGTPVYLYEKDGEDAPTSESVIVSNANYATYSSEFALNFSNKGITVYKAKANGTSVSLTPIGDDGIVPAYTGVVLYANGGASADVPVATSVGSTDWTNNEMVANVKRAKVYLTEGEKTNYILSNETAGVGFYKAAVNGAYLPANRAYLSTTETTSAPFLSFDEGTTGIVNVNRETITNNQYYTLDGRRVENPSNGIYIVNGKKVVVK